MTRPLRVQYPGALYHVTNRGNERKPVFGDDADRLQFLKILSRSVEIYQAVIHAFVLMDNHYHLLVETPLGNLSEFMRHFNITYTSYFNRRHRRAGHLFQGRYKSVLVEKDSYLNAVSMYIHLNPVKVRGVMNQPRAARMEHLLGVKWSSLAGIVSPKARHDFVDYSLVLADYGGDTAGGRKAYLARLEESLARGLEIKEKVVGQSVLGDESFVAWVQESFLDKAGDRERPAVARLCSHVDREKVIAAIAEEFSLSRDELFGGKGEQRYLLMDMLYRFAGMNNREIGELVGVDYSTVSLGRKKFNKKRRETSETDAVAARIEADVSRIKI